MTATQLPIEYNTAIPVGAPDTDPYRFLLYDRLFEDFRIVMHTDQQWVKDLGLRAKLTYLDVPAAQKEEGHIDRLLISKRFADMHKTDSRRKYVLFSPLDPPYRINPLAFLMNSPTIAHAYENKRYFRDEFSDLIRMPDYEIKYMSELDRATSYKDLYERFGGAFMLQDEESSGSKGTHAIHNHDDYVEAIKTLKRFSQGRTIVASEFIGGEVSSIQVCITKYGIFSGGLQRQLLGSKYLCNVKLAGATRWVGGEVGSDYPEIVQHQAQEIASVVGSELASHGYKGIFGIDLIVTPEKVVYAIEINARLTGYSQIISDLQYTEGKIPFMLLHLLELGNFKYEVTDYEALPSMARYKRSASLLIVANPLTEPLTLKHYIRPGMYVLKDDRVEFVKPATSLDALKGDDTMLIFSRYNQGDQIETGKRILKITKLGKTMSKGDLNPKAQQIVQAVKRTFDLPE